MQKAKSGVSLFGRGSLLETRRVADILRTETAGGLLLVAAALAAVILANTPWSDSYTAVSDAEFGPSGLHLHLSVAEWTADGLLAIFFFVAGLELKREFVAGDLRDPRRAALPVAAAIGGMAVPALIYTVVNVVADNGAPRGWAIPSATDIAFALAVLGLINTHLPSSLRTFLLTLAVVDDLLAIVIIAVFYTSGLHLAPLLLALIPLAAFGVLVQRRVRSWWLLLPLALVTWALVHASGVHATVAGVLLAFTVPVLRRDGGTGPGLAEHFEHRWRPLSAGFAVPLFAFFAAGVTIGGAGGLSEPVTIGVVLGLLLGKPVGVLVSSWLVHRFTRAELATGLSWWDVTGVATLAGVGFTVSLLIGELAFGPGSSHDENAKLGILVGSVLAAAVASVLLRARNRHYRRLVEEEERDDDRDGIPDVYQRGDTE
ncbi:Na+/H+ antiporter NhaA [Asanoa iriomotensis]|uniref:Na(+)/H(+) antiporter NhaA n=1 Tax=Asanoa iriomotensis TaxID=234613 RepID=A0ABQ4BYA2_9ACTN|nr:Na+/H+ antiporter NhaA [Asanoa iriomotensis]GIF55502.1 Na(+)/H(+) antiporter NhaA [Asanoa iriomotensis]